MVRQATSGRPRETALAVAGCCMDAQDQPSARCEGSRCDGKGDADPRLLDEDPGNQRSDESPETLDGRGGGVRGDQLLRRPGQGREQRLERGPDEGGRDPDECGARIDAALCSGERGDCRSREGDRAEKHRAE